MPDISQYGFELDGLVLMMLFGVQVLFVLVFAVLPMSNMPAKNRGSLIIAAVLAVLALNLTFFVAVTLLDGEVAIEAKLTSLVITLVGLGCGFIMALCVMFGVAALMADSESDSGQAQNAA